jgi:cytochrome P450
MDYISGWQDGKERIITQDMMSVALSIISKTMFSMDFKEGYDVLGEPIETCMKIAVRRMRTLLQFPIWIPTKSNREYKNAIQTLDTVLFNIIEKRRKDPVSQDDMLGILMDARDKKMASA